MKLLAFIPNRPRCGVSDYARQLYPSADCLGEPFEVRRLAPTLRHCLQAPFSGADLLHLQHEYSMFGFAGCWGFLLLCYLWLLRPVGPRLVLTLHTVYDWNRTEEIFAHRTRSRLLLGCLRVYGKVYHRLMLAASSLLVLLSEASRDKLLQVTPAARRARLAVIPIGAYDLLAAAPAPAGRPGSGAAPPAAAAAPEVAASDYVLTLFGFAYPNKGYHLAIEALGLLGERAAGLKLLVVSGEPAEGGRQYLEDLKQLVGRLRLQHQVVFTGYLAAEDPQFEQTLRRTNCFLYPYLGESATSGSLATTLSARKVYITSDLNMFRSFSPAIKFHAGQAAELANAIEHVRQMDAPALARYREELDAFARACSIESTRKHHVEQFLQILPTAAQG